MPVQTYKIEIDTDQLQMLIAAQFQLTNNTKQPNNKAAAQELLQLLINLPSEEQTHPDAIHGLCF